MPQHATINTLKPVSLLPHHLHLALISQRLSTARVSINSSHTRIHTHSKWRHFSPCLMEPQRANRDNHLPSNQQQQQQWQRQQQQHRLWPEDRVAWRASRHKRDGVTESKQKHERTPMISSLPLSLPLCFAPECHFTITIRDPFSYPLLVGFSGRKLSLGPD